MRTNLLTSRL